MNNPITDSEYPFANLQLPFAFLWRVGRFLDHFIQVDSSQTPPGHGSDNLDFKTTSKIFWYPFQIELFDNIIKPDPKYFSNAADVAGFILKDFVALNCRPNLG